LGIPLRLPRALLDVGLTYVAALALTVVLLGIPLGWDPLISLATYLMLESWWGYPFRSLILDPPALVVLAVATPVATAALLALVLYRVLGDRYPSLLLALLPYYVVGSAVYLAYPSYGPDVDPLVALAVWVPILALSGYTSRSLVEYATRRYSHQLT
jgi:hypothetical protein